MARRTVNERGIYHDEVTDTYFIKVNRTTRRGFETIKEAKIARAAILLEEEDIDFAKLEVVIESYLQDQLHRVKSEEIRYGTYNKKESIIRLYISDSLGRYRLNNLTPKVLRNYRNSLISLDLSTYQKNYALQTLNSILNYARVYYGFDKDLSIFLERFPQTASEKKKNKDRFANIWSARDFNAFVEGMEDNYKLIFTLMFKHGLRLGEAQALRYVDVDCDKSVISINGSMTRKTRDGSYQRGEPKSTSSSREIYIGDTIELINNIYNDKKDIYRFNDKWYITNNNRPLSDKSIQRKREKHIKISGLPSCTNHDMRHMFVSNAWSSGVPITAISAYVGHRNVAETLNTYSHLTQKDNDKMNDYIGLRK